MKKIHYFLLLLFTLAMVSSCKNEDITGTEEEQMANYISTNKLTVTEETSSGLRYCRITPSTGNAVKSGQSITVSYAGKFMNGKQFDAGSFTFTLGIGQVVKGFDEGVAKMKVGEKAIIVFPSSLGYGAFGNSTIPGGSPLAFEITVTKAV